MNLLTACGWQPSYDNLCIHTILKIISKYIEWRKEKEDWTITITEQQILVAIKFIPEVFSRSAHRYDSYSLKSKNLFFFFLNNTKVENHGIKNNKRMGYYKIQPIIYIFNCADRNNSSLWGQWLDLTQI